MAEYKPLAVLELFCQDTMKTLKNIGTSFQIAIHFQPAIRSHKDTSEYNKHRHRGGGGARGALAAPPPPTFKKNEIY